MNKLPRINVSFIIGGKYIGFEQLNKEIGIEPTEIRGLDDWPEAIKSNLDLPEELQPRRQWSICQRVDSCREGKNILNKQ